MPTSENGRNTGWRNNKGAGSNDSSFVASVLRFSQRTHAADYLGLAIVAACWMLLKFFGGPFHAQFRLDDPRIQHPHAEVERVPVPQLFIYAVAVPAAVLLAWALLLRVDLYKAHITFLGLFISIVTTLFLTDLFKDAIGRPRPDLIARCKPYPDTPRDEMVSIDVCTETDSHTLIDGWRSYPSGHSSFSFAGLGWLALVLASQMHVLRPRANFTAVLLCMTPLIAAALIAISRLEDYRHDVFDVVSGSFLGIVVALFHWRRYYPSLLAWNCDEPYRQQALDGHNGHASPDSAFHRVRDEEEDGYVRGLDHNSPTNHRPYY